MARPERAASPRLTITEQDYERLTGVIERYDSGRQPEPAELLDAELARAKVVPQGKVPADVVTMRSRVVIEDTSTGRSREFTLAYPEEADAGQARLSVLAPVGTAVLGLKVGDEIAWKLPGGATTTLRVVSIPFQPEAEGRFDL